MNEKEKAKELVSKFENTMFISHEEAKGCAKIAVNEIILHNYEHLEGDKYHDRLNELEQLIKEIDNI